MNTSTITPDTTIGTIFIDRVTGIVYRYTGMSPALFGETQPEAMFTSLTANGAGTRYAHQLDADLDLVWEAPEVLRGIDLVKNGEVEHFEFREDRLNDEVNRLVLDGWYVLLSEEHVQQHVSRLHGRGASSVEMSESGSVFCHDHSVAFVAA
jgi:hypothetical protein